MSLDKLTKYAESVNNVQKPSVTRDGTKTSSLCLNFP